MCQRYQNNPFGTNKPRFDYQTQSKKSQLTTDMNNGMIAVKDQEIMEKRAAYQRTLEKQKKLMEL